MKIVIADIPDEGLVVDFNEKFTGDDVRLPSPVEAHLEIHGVGKEIIVEGRLKADLELQCSRCLKDFRRSLDIPVNVVYHPIADIGNEKRELKDDEMDMGFYKGEELNMQELLKEQILLNIQMKPLCAESCRGICPQCGTDLNSGQCSCVNKEGDLRLEVLKKFLEKRKE